MKLILIISIFFSYQISFSQEIKREREIFDCVETKFYDTPPTFKGDSTRMQKYIQKHLKYPSEAIRANVEGKVYVRFSVSEKGKIDSLDVLKSIGFGCDEEALRIVKTMRKWTPAINKNIFVSSHYVVPVIFKLNQE
jgi:periplasmic protein TonB